VSSSDVWFRQLPRQLPPLTDEMVAKAEKLLGVTLPESYVSLLRIQNGGYLRRDGKLGVIDECWPDCNAGIGIYGIDPDGIGYSILCTPYMTQEWGLPKRLVLLWGDGHWWVALDYRVRADDPPVMYLDEEMAQDVLVAESFQSLLNAISGSVKAQE
jgi:hypothetical protein